MFNGVFDEFWKMTHLSFNKKYGWSQNGVFLLKLV